jgi:DNA-binding CsgD family transcriptional regulator
MALDELKSTDWMALARVWGELNEIPLADSDEAVRHLLGSLCALTGARESFLAFGMRSEPAAHDPMDGWRWVGKPINFQRSEAHSHLASAWQAENLPSFDKHTQGLVGTGGRHRAFLRPELVDDAQWRLCQSRELLHVLEIEDRLVGACAVSPRVEIYFVLDRHRHDEIFSARERDLLLAALGGLQSFGRRLSRSYGVIDASRLLAPRERETLRYLLSGLSEKQIADAMGLTSKSLHQYVVALFRNFSVQSRAELMALWLNPKRLSPGP